MSSDRPGLTELQATLVDFISAFIREHGWAPTVREAMPCIGAQSTSSVVYQLRQLEQKGWIKRGPGPRQLTLITPDTEATSCTPPHP